MGGKSGIKISSSNVVASSKMAEPEDLSRKNELVTPLAAVA